MRVVASAVGEPSQENQDGPILRNRLLTFDVSTRTYVRHMVQNWIRTKCWACGTSGAPLCRRCSDELGSAPVVHVPGLDDVYALYQYEGVAKQLVTRAKFSSAVSSLRWMADQMVTGLGNIDVDCVSWVPGSWEGRLQRGYDPAQLVAKRLSRSLRCPSRRLLSRRPGQPQHQRNRAQRLDGPSFDPTWRKVPERVLLVDDVLTTGASLARSAEVLRWSGATYVHGAVVAAVPASIPRLRSA